MTHETIKTGEPLDLSGFTPEGSLTDETILLEPDVLESGLSTMLNRYAASKTANGMRITPDTIIEFEHNGQRDEALVFAAETAHDTRRQVIYQKTAGQAAEWIVITSTAASVSITDGAGRALESEEDRRFVRSVLDTMKTDYEESAISKADDFDIKGYVLEQLDSSISVQETALAALRKQRGLLSHTDAPFNFFRIDIHSSWEKEGERSFSEHISAPTLSEALRQAVATYKERRGRNDIQAQSLSVNVLAGSNTYYQVPKEVVAPLFQALSQWDGEASQIERTRKPH